MSNDTLEFSPSDTITPFGGDYFHELEAENAKLRHFRDTVIMAARLKIERQAEDEVLWQPAKTWELEYIQFELRDLHRVIEAAVAAADEEQA